MKLHTSLPHFHAEEFVLVLNALGYFAATIKSPNSTSVYAIVDDADTVWQLFKEEMQRKFPWLYESHSNS
jgi:hypothetical protein